ncbi:MAG TPA: inositol-3-phosphate synthase, partial [Candidatus Latescibacteria bacterium]|nr:inositol-3-phosphate synthase [Candidatus Latescibacterota bacterium]
MNQPSKIQEPSGKLGVLTPGMGAVSTTFMAGIEAIKAGIGEPIGSLTQMGHIRLGKRTDNTSPLIRDFVPLAGLEDLVFGGWDVFEDDVYAAASHAGVLAQKDLDVLKDRLTAIKPMKAIFDRNYVRRLEGSHVKQASSKWDLAQMAREDIQRFKSDNGLDRVVVIWCGSTEIFLEPTAVHASVEAFETGLKDSDEGIAP